MNIEKSIGKMLYKDNYGKNNLGKAAKETIGLGIGSMAGMGAMGAMQAIPGMPAQASGVTSTVGTSLNLLNTGQMLKNTKNIFGGKSKW